MVSVSSTSTPASTSVSAPVAAANKTLSMLLLSNDMTQALSSQSSSYVPATSNQVLSTLWAMFDTTNSHTISKSDVQTAVIAEGGKPSDANALWAQMDPTGKPSLNAGDFISIKYLTQGVASNLKAVQAAVATIQQQQGPSATGDILGGFMSVGGSGSLISDVGNGSASVNIFV